MIAMLAAKPSDPIPAPDTRCTVCGDEVDQKHPHIKWASFTNLGVLHDFCEPPQGMDAWLRAKE